MKMSEYKPLKEPKGEQKCLPLPREPEGVCIVQRCGDGQIGFMPCEKHGMGGVREDG